MQITSKLKIVRTLEPNTSPSFAKGENPMNTVEQRTAELDRSKFENNSVFLWLGQNFRKIQGKPLLQEDVLDKVVNQLKADENLLGILLFGSVASRTHT